MFVKISSTKLRLLCAERHMGISSLLREAGVSRTAFYSLARKGSILPRSIERIAAHLQVRPSAFIDDDGSLFQRVRDLQSQTEAIHQTNRKLDRDVIYRTLANLELAPLERLRRALIRGQAAHLLR